MKPWVVRTLLALGTVVALDQVAQYTVLRGGYVSGRRIAPFDPPLFTRIQSESLERIRSHLATGNPPLAALDFDPELGWCPKPDSNSELYQYDWAGCRIGNQPLARQRDPNRRRAAAIGCSFTLGAEVGAKDTWEAQLERLAPTLEVANLGVGGSGIDQALLRLRRDGLFLNPEEVWLGVQPEALARIVTTYMPALSHWGFPVGFKPRFGLEPSGNLRVVPLPVHTLNDVSRLMSSQVDFLAAVGNTDRWISSNPTAYAPFGSSWMHRSSLARVLLTAREKRGRHVADELRDPESELFRLARQICRTASAEAVRSGARFRVWLFPDRGDLQMLEEQGSAYWQRLVEALRQDGIEVLDLTEALQAAGGGKDARLWAPETHYSAQGNEVVARALSEYLTRK